MNVEWSQSKKVLCIWCNCCGVVLCASACNVASVFCCLFQSVTKWEHFIMHKRWQCSGSSVAQRTDCKLPWYPSPPTPLFFFFFSHCNFLLASKLAQNPSRTRLVVWKHNFVFLARCFVIAPVCHWAYLTSSRSYWKLHVQELCRVKSNRLPDFSAVC